MLTAIRILRGLAVALLVAGALSGCTDTPTQPQQPVPVPGGKLVVHANVGTSGINGLLVQVSGPGIVKSGGTPDTLSFNIAIVDGVASGTIVIPAGPARVVTARAFEGVVETHRGSVVTDIAEGVNPQLRITLVPLVGDVPITLELGTTLVIVRPAVGSVAVGDTIHMSAEVRDNNGNIVNGAVRWASLNPGRATVTGAGVVTMRDTGEVQIVATYGTVGGSARLTGTGVLSQLSYHLTWNGTTSDNWMEPNNWTPHGVGVARVPTALDSVVIPAAAPRWPRPALCADSFHVRDLVVESGANIQEYCSNGVNVYGSADVRNPVSVAINARPGARLMGAFGRITVYGDSVRLAGATSATYVNVNAPAASLALDGHSLTVNGNFDVNNGTVTLRDGDTLIVEGNVSWYGGDHLGKLDGGVVRFRGQDFYGYRYKAGGTNRLVFERPSGNQWIYSFNYLSEPARAGLRKWEVLTRDTLRICAHVAVDDTLRIAGQGTTAMVVEQVGCGGYYVRAGGPVVTTQNVSVQNHLWQLTHASGTSLVEGPWVPTYTDFYAMDGVVKPGLGYNALRFFASNRFRGVTSAGSLYLSGSGVEVAVGGNVVSVSDRLDVENNAVLAMLSPADSMLVTNQASFSANASGLQQPRMTAGLLRVGSNFYGYGFGSTGTHVLELAGTSTAGGQSLSGMDHSRPTNDIARLRITGGAYGLCGHARVTVRLELEGTSRLQQQCGGYYVTVMGRLVTAAGTTFEPYLVALHDTTGTGLVEGAFAPAYTDFHAAGARVRPGLTYAHLRIYQPVTLSGRTQTTGYVQVNGGSSELALGGNTLVVGAHLQVDGGGTIRMHAPTDSLLVSTYASFNDNVSGIQKEKVTAGTIRVGSYFYGYGFAASDTGSNTVIMASGGSHPDRYISGMNFEGRPAQAFRNLEIGTGATYGLCERVRVTGVLRVRAGATLQDWCGSPYLRVEGDLVTETGSIVKPYDVDLGNATGTLNVGGSFEPVWTSVISTLAAGQLKVGLGYSNLAVYAPMSLAGDMDVNGQLYLKGAATNLTLGGHRLTVAGTLNLDEYATITMTNPADTIVANGDVYWDGGASHAGKLTTGTLILRGARFNACQYYGSVDNRIVFDRTSGLNSVECVNSSTPQNMPFEQVEVTGNGISLSCHMWVGGSLRVRTGARIEPQCGGGTIWITDTLYTEPGSVLANNATNNWPLSVVLYDTAGSGTSQVNGTYSAGATYFVGRDSWIKPELDYKYVRVDASTRFRGPTEIDGQLDVIANAILDLAGSKVSVGGMLNFDSNARLRMNSPADTLIVAANNPAAEIYWDGGDNLTGDAGNDYLLTDGVILFHGQRMYAPRYRPQASSAHKFVFANNNSGLSAVSIEGMNPDVAAPPSFNRLEIAGLRPVHVNYRMRVDDTLRMAPNTRLTGGDYVWLAGVTSGGSPGDLVTGAGSFISMPAFYLDDPSGTSQVQGVFRPTRTYFRAAQPLASAIKPGLEYGDVYIHNGDYVLAAGDTTLFTGSLEVSGTASSLDFAGRRLRVRDGNVSVSNGGRLIMAQRLLVEGSQQPGVDSLLVGGSIYFAGNAGVSTLAGGVIVMGGYDFTIDRNDMPLTGTRLVMNGTGTGYQNINTGGTNRDLYQVDIVGTRPVRLQRGTVVSDALRLLGSTASLTSGQPLSVRGALSSDSGSTITFSNVLELSDPSGTSLIAGSYSNSYITRFNPGSTVIKGGPGMSYGHLDIFGFASTAGGPLTLSGNLTLGSSTLYGPDNVSLTMPAGSSVGGYIETFGPLSFAAGATTAGDLTVRAGGSATALGTGATDYVDFRSIYLNAASAPRGAGVLDNSVADNGAGGSTGIGFRRASTGTFSQSTGVLMGPAPAIRP